MKTVLITGASSGIGKETAYVFARNGFNLIITARREDLLNAIKKDIETDYKCKVDVIVCDLSLPDSANRL